MRKRVYIVEENEPPTLLEELLTLAGQTQTTITRDNVTKQYRDHIMHLCRIMLVIINSKRPWHERDGYLDNTPSEVTNLELLIDKLEIL